MTNMIVSPKTKFGAKNGHRLRTKSKKMNL